MRKHEGLTVKGEGEDYEYLLHCAATNCTINADSQFQVKVLMDSRVITVEISRKFAIQLYGMVDGTE